MVIFLQGFVKLIIMKKLISKQNDLFWNGKKKSLIYKGNSIVCVFFLDSFSNWPIYYLHISIKNTKLGSMKSGPARLVKDQQTLYNNSPLVCDMLICYYCLHKSMQNCLLLCLFLLFCEKWKILLSSTFRRIGELSCSCLCRRPLKFWWTCYLTFKLL